MSDVSQLVRAPVPNAIAPKPKGYQATNEVRLRANVTAGNETPEQQVAINKLGRTLDSSETPRADVPRGYYLNILV